MLMIFGPQDQKPKNPLKQILMVLIWLVVLALAFTFSLFFFVVVGIVGLGYWLYFWWKTRSLRQILREQMHNASSQGEQPFQRDDPESIIIEGESVRLEDDEEDNSP